MVFSISFHFLQARHRQFLPFLIWKPVPAQPIAYDFVVCPCQVSGARCFLTTACALHFSLVFLSITSCSGFFGKEEISKHMTSFHHSYLFTLEHVQLFSRLFRLCKGCIRVHPLWMFVMAAPLSLGRDMPCQGLGWPIGRRFLMIYLLNMLIFHSYVKLPEGNSAPVSLFLLHFIAMMRGSGKIREYHLDLSDAWTQKWQSWFDDSLRPSVCGGYFRTSLKAG